MISRIPATHEERQKLIGTAQARYIRSRQYFRSWHEKWVRFYKVYRAIKDAAGDEEDEPNTFLPYAFGIIENIVAKAVEPLFKLKPPCRVSARKKGHSKAADNFATVARNYFSGSEYQIDYTESFKEEAITGNAWEKDEFLNEWEDAKVWAVEQRQGVLGAIESLTGKIVQLFDTNAYSSEQKVEKSVRRPSRVGYHTAFPSVFLVHPEPGVKKVRDMHWLIEEEEEVALDDLKKAMYKDPETGEMRPVFDLAELEASYGAHEPGAITPERWGDKNYSEEMRSALGIETNRGSSEATDIDRVWLVHVWEKGRVYTIAQGRFVIRVIEDPFHRARIPFRLRRYSVDKESFYGIGVIEPIEELLYELNDVHNLSMSNWIRIINRMLVYDMQAIPFPEDFNPRAGGKIRMRGDTDAKRAIASVDHEDVSPSMLAMESNSRGLIEWATSMSDLSPGAAGTKQNHDTLGGLLEIQANLNTRFAAIQRMHLANYQEQMDAMEAIFSQFQFEKLPMRSVADDGSTAMVELNMDDVYTEGVGFDYLIEADPSYGDDQVQRQMLMALMGIAERYEKWRMTFGDAMTPKMDLAEIMRKILGNFGWSDTSQVLKKPDGTMDPGGEMEIMLGGMAVEPNPAENLIAHLIDHTIQRNSPKLREAMAAGQVDPKVVAMLDMHIAKTAALIQMVMSDPVRAAQERMAQAAMDRPAGGGMGGAAGMAAGGGMGGGGGMNG